MTVESLLARIASASPSTGGGAAVAMTAAVAAALVAMVASIAVRYAPGEPALGDLVAEAEALRARLTSLIDLDVDAYRKVAEAQRRSDAGRAAALRDALIGATEVPFEIAAAGARLLEQGATLLAHAWPSTLADLGVAGFLASAVLEGAALTARSNLDALDDRAFAADARRRLDDVLRRGAVVRARLSQAFAASPA